MTMHLHHLTGCAPAPLAHYLKALGILRLVAEQADPQARGCWRDEHFCFVTKLDRDELERFFLERYEPTPIFNPWGGRSGYYTGSNEKTARSALQAIEQSTDQRLSSFRDAIALVRAVIDEGGGEKPDKTNESIMLRRITARIRGTGADWLASVVADIGDRFSKPAIFGSGGNEGSGSYTAAFLAGVVECVHNRAWDMAISPSLWSDGADRDRWDGSFRPCLKKGNKKSPKESVDAPFRQYLPGSDGSPWDLLLAFEGALVVQSGVSRRTDKEQNRFLASPFYFSSLGVGAGSSSEMDEYTLNKGKKNPGRGEQWFPLWNAPSTYRELQRLFREGHCTVGKRAAKQPIDAARAICSLGTSRGINTFLRFGYLQRDNLAMHFAVPLGRVHVPDNQKDNKARLIDDLAGWLNKLHRLARNERPKPPDRLVLSYRRFASAVFAALTHDHTPDRWQAILLTAADIEAIQATGSAIEAGPIPPLGPEWVAAVDDGSSEIRLALALGSAAASYFKRPPVDPVRHHLLPLEEGARRFKISDKRLMNEPRIVMSGRDPIRDLSDLVDRRMIESGMKGDRRSRLVSAPGCEACWNDLAKLLRGAIDLKKVLGLARAFMAINWPQVTRENLPALGQSSGDAKPAEDESQKPPREEAVPEAAWLVLRLASLPWKLDRNHDIPAEPAMVRRLICGDGAGAVAIAIRRLHSSGLRPPIRSAFADTRTAQLWAAALAFPISPSTALRAAKILDPSFNWRPS